ncbi:MAG: tRNA lysidine(34) synthetase TilS [Pseudomonadota bacterium]
MPRLPEKSVRCDFLKKVERTIHDFCMIRELDSVLVCVSGGPDSTALLHALQHLSSGLSMTLGVAHVNHRLRAEDSDRDEKFVASLAGEMKIPFHVKRCNVRQYARENRMSLEDGARKVRYDFFLDLCAGKHGYSRIATAHHLDDNAELILMNLFRGSGKSGISGIPPIRRKIIIRPLIQVSKKEILAFLSENRLPYRLDSTNQDERFTRNRIRHHLIPELQSFYNPRIMEALNRTASIIQSEEEWLDNLVERETGSLILSETDQSIRISIPDFLDKPFPLRRRIARHIIQKVKGDVKKITLRHIDNILLLIARSIDNRELHLPDDLLVNISDHQACFMIRKRMARPLKNDPQSKTPIAFCYRIPDLNDLPKIMIIPEVGASIRFSIPDFADLPEPDQQQENIALMDRDQIRCPLTIRNWVPGDRFTPLGMTGTKKVGKFFMDRKVPQKKRLKCPVLLSQDRIIWLAGHQIDDSIKITPATNTVLKAELFLA